MPRIWEDVASWITLEKYAEVQDTKKSMKYKKKQIHRRGQANDMVNISFVNSNVKSPGIIEKLETSSYQNSVNTSYEIDTGSNGNCSLDQKKKLLS